jgi:hypothetical protein
LFGCIFLMSMVSPSSLAQLSTTDHLADPGFWPTKNSAPPVDYAGTDACASCHVEIAQSQRRTPMAETTVRAGTAEILRSHPSLNFAVGDYYFKIKTTSEASVYTVTNGNQHQSAKLLWTFGTGRVGQSYLFKKADGKFYEARVTYFGSLHNLGFTPDRALNSPKNIDEAMDRPVDEAEVGRCLSCHTTASSVKGKLDEKNLIPGITCESCHGPAAQHVQTMSLANLNGNFDLNERTVFNPSRLNPVDSVDFCGSCHGTWWDVKLSGVKGVSTVKSQPYRLENSKCWGKGDARLTCVACHDPHKQLQTDAVSYDRNCLGCHAAKDSLDTEKNMAHACPVSTNNCVSCHMPKVNVPEMHYNFTDHWIRVAKAGEAYPE